jgi:hydroxyacylglutathione hydrolase
MKLIPLPALTDNYIWMLHNGQDALVVDPGESTQVFDALQRERVELKGILVTHHHGDHTAGVKALRDATGAQVYGPALETMPEPIARVQGGDEVPLCGVRFDVLDLPGHTLGHVGYYCAQVNDHPLVFCGDTLFSGGCGRLFEGTPQQMQTSLGKLAALPPDTVVCCTHEYTLSNLKFAMGVEPSNEKLQNYLAHCVALRGQGKPTLPSTIGLEREINPFLRVDMPQVIQAVHSFDPQGAAHHGVFASLRQWKNQT